MNVYDLSNANDVIDLDSRSNSPDIQVPTASNSSASPAHTSKLHHLGESLSAETITFNLKFHKKNWSIIDAVDKKSNCWKCFGIPVRHLLEGKKELLDKFVSCKHCCMTYAYSSSTRNMNKHIAVCDGYNLNQSHFTSPTENSSLQLDTTSLSPYSASSTTKNLASHKEKMTNLLGEWICSNIRPLSIVEDTGFKKIFDEAIRIGYVCGPIKSENILSSRKTITRYIKSNALDGRGQIKNVLLKAARERCLVLSPDIWSDAYRQQSYLGCTAHWIDDNWILHVFEIFCMPFNTPNKKAPNVLKTLKEGLSMYDLVEHMKNIIWVTDRGSNIKKILEEYEVVFCAGHRLNNILEKVFFQSDGKSKKKKKKEELNDDDNDENEEEKMSNSEQSENDCDDDDMISRQHPPTNQRQQHHKKKKIDASSTKVTTKVNHLVILVSEIPPEAKRVVDLIVSSKQLVKYVKLININPILEEKKSPRLVQSTIVRWLSMSNCLEALSKSYLTLSIIFDERDLNKKYLERINIVLLDKIIEFLKPWKQISTRLQSDNVPSIHVVIPAIENLKASLERTTDGTNTKVSNEKDMAFFRERAKVLIENMFSYHPVHLMAIFLNPKTRKMKQCTDDQRNSCLEYIKQEMILFDDVDDDIPLNNNNNKSTRKTSDDVNHTLRIMEQYYEDEDEQDDIPSTSATLHQTEINNYLKFAIVKSNDSYSSKSIYISDQEFNPLQFWKLNHTSYPRLAKIAKHIFAIPATSAAVEREFSLAGNVVTKKRSRLSPETVNDIIFQHSFEKYRIAIAQNK